MKKLLSLKCVMLLLCGIIITANSSYAAIVFSNYGNDDTHSTTGGWSVLNNVQPPYYPTDTDWDMGMSFTPNADYYLDTIEFTATSVAGSNELDIWLMSSSNGKPDTTIETFHLSNSMDNHSWSQHDPLLVNSTLTPILSANTTYWIVLSTPEEGSSVIWYQNSIEDTGPRALWTNDHWGIANDVTTAVFRVTGSPVPIPSAFLLLGSGLIGIVGIRRKVIN